MIDIGWEIYHNIIDGVHGYLSMEMSRLTRDGTAEPVSRDQNLRHERGQGNIHVSGSADHVQDWQPYPVGPYSCYMCSHTDSVYECSLPQHVSTHAVFSYQLLKGNSPIHSR